jgi:hypothetical protein
LGLCKGREKENFQDLLKKRLFFIGISWENHGKLIGTDVTHQEFSLIMEKEWKNNKSQVDELLHGDLSPMLWGAFP